MERIVSVLRCPYSGAPLHLSSDHLGGGLHRYPIVDGIPWLLEEERLAAIDQHFQLQYGDDTARKYDRVIRFQSMLIGCWEPAERRRMVELLSAPKGGRVLEVAVGTGANLPFLSRRVGPEGELLGVDLSMAMIHVARRRARSLQTPIHFARADACHLPFADDTFDAVFHFGGLNMFGDVGAALREMVRVAKPGATIVASDEGMSETRRRTWLGRRLGRMNTLNLCRPPFAELPWEHVEDFELHWAWRELFYVMRFRKAAPSRGESTADTGNEGRSTDPVVAEVVRRAKW